jgi:hypothetical protein
LDVFIGRTDESFSVANTDLEIARMLKPPARLPERMFIARTASFLLNAWD